MKNTTKENERGEVGAVELRLPGSATTKSGIVFNPSSDLWIWVDGPFQVHLDFSRLLVHKNFPLASLKHTLLVFAKLHSPSYLMNLFYVFSDFLKHRSAPLLLKKIGLDDISSYSNSLGDGRLFRLGTLNTLLQKWAALQLPGIDEGVVESLRERRKPGCQKGGAVRTRDPQKGPFSEAEYTALYKSVDSAYGVRAIQLWTVVLARLLFACGGRPSQFASLKIRDFEGDENSFVLHLPLVKTRDQFQRSSFQSYPLSRQTARLVREYVEQLKMRGLDDEGPLFPASVVMKSGRRKVVRSKNDPFFGHCTSSTLSAAFVNAMDEIAPPTDRLDFKPVPVTPQRFRYTFGTRLVEEGASKALVADRLTHTDLQNVEVYFEASPKIVDNIDRAMGAMLAPLSRAFRGRLIQDEEQATHKGDPSSRIIDFRVSKNPVGNCAGKAHGCAFRKPVACYTCYKFEPWLDAPHEKILHYLEAERDRFSGDPRIAAINDDAIKAVLEVMADCETAFNQRQAGKAHE